MYGSHHCQAGGMTFIFALHLLLQHPTELRCPCQHAVFLHFSAFAFMP